MLELGRSSDVDPLRPEQVADARRVLRRRRSGEAVWDDQRRIVERFLAGRRAHFGAEQSRPLADVPAFVHEGRDIFVVVKFMDEGPHLSATLRSLLDQRGIDLGRVVILAVDHNSTDGSDAVVKEAIASNRTAARILYLNQPVPGAGSAARLGVDTCIATVYEMCRVDNRWDRLQSATIAVSDGDTVYHPETLSTLDGMLAHDPDVDGVMPFLTYKFTAALRLFHDHTDHLPTRGFERALAFLMDGRVRTDERWRWHSVIGHDLFLYWSFAGMGLPESMVFPDTSDALKTFRVWSFAIGGQHQLRRPGLRIATGSDYQSGRVLQAVGCTVRLGPAGVFAETETDRLIKMVRNFVRRQSVFYGETRSAAFERATGLYLHMTRIQGEIERELRSLDDDVFAHTVFPERVLFPLRWILQNAVRYYAHGHAERGIVRERVLRVMFPGSAERIERHNLDEATVRAVVEAPFAAKQDLAERVAERIIEAHYPEIMAFYGTTLRSFFDAYDISAESYEWLLDGVAGSLNALVERPPAVDPAAVWDSPEFDIDVERGQVTRMRTG